MLGSFPWYFLPCLSFLCSRGHHSLMALWVEALLAGCPFISYKSHSELVLPVGGQGHSKVKFYRFIFGRLGLVFLPLLTSLVVLLRLFIDWAGWWAGSSQSGEQQLLAWESDMIELPITSNVSFLRELLFSPWKLRRAMPYYLVISSGIVLWQW